ncbi:MAG: ABC transporter ATP-binding protein [Pseudomonadota bacterium]
MNRPPVLCLNDLIKTYRRGQAEPIEVLRGVSLSLRIGEIVALVAPSGAGKSTLLHIAGLLDTPDSGAVWIAGRELTGRSDFERTAARRREIGFVYQFHHLLPEFSALENVVLPQLANGIAEKAARTRGMALLDRVGMAARADHRPGALSGGEQQRVAFCRALANAPKVLLADEPTGNLDPDTSEQVCRVLVDLARDEGLAAVIATHDPDMAARMDRIVRLERGRLFG